VFYRLSPALVMRSRWQPYRARAGERVLVLKTASVFPPGHPTTLLSLDLLMETLTAGRPPRLLDVGCGCGVLLLAAAALGVPRCVGVDVWPPAARISRENALGNGLAGAVVIQGSTECLRGNFELILANLPIAAHLIKAAELARLAAPAGVLIISGFKDTQEEEVLSRYRLAGWKLLRRGTRDDWLTGLAPELISTWVAGRLTREPEPPAP
jgi:ribosomal protein L11 methyltransferase